MTRHRRTYFARLSGIDARRIISILRTQAVGGALVMAAAAIALVISNSPLAESYHSLMAYTIGPASLRLDLPVSAWAADGLLAIFFFTVGVELKREFVAGDLRDPARAALPVAAAVAGMAVPALFYTLTNLTTGGEALNGWAIPAATDIAFAVAVLALVGSGLPLALRTFLLTVAIADDLLAIIAIAVFYTGELHLELLGLAVIPLALFGAVVQRRITAWWVLLPLAFTTWALVHASGIHATIAGVLLGFTVPVLASRGSRQLPGLSEFFTHRIQPVSAGIAVPLFAFCAAGVTVGGLEGLTEAFRDPIAIGIILGLVVGKPVGILGAAYLLSRFTRADLDPDIRWSDLTAVAMLCGIGFTVSLLISELAFVDAVHTDHAKIGVLAGSLTAATLASVVLYRRAAKYRRAALRTIEK